MAQKPNLLGDLLRSVRKRLNLSIPNMAAKLGVNKNTLASYEREERLPDVEFLAVFAKVTGWDLGKLLEARLNASLYSDQFQSTLRSLRGATDDVTLFAIRRSGIPTERLAYIRDTAFRKGLDAEGVEREFGAQFPILNRDDEHAPGARLTAEDFVMVPRYDVHGSAGHGAVVHSEQIVDYLAFRADWVRNALGVARKDLVLISVKGDSMEPTLSSGDLILVDRSADRVEDSAIYVLKKSDGLFVKRLQHKLDGTVVVKCDNERYDSETYSAEAATALVVVGRVVWAGRKL